MRGFCGIFCPHDVHMVASELNGMLRRFEPRVSGQIRQRQGEGAAMAQWGLPGAAPHTAAAGSQRQSLLCSRDGRFWMVADARLDARSQLTSTLQGALGGVADSGDEIAALLDLGSDEALLLAAYLAWGEDSPAHLVGDFAFSIWDSRLRRLFAARDPFGVKPLVYARWPGGFAVASEAFTLLQLSTLASELDEVSIALYLARHRTDEDRTFFRHIAALPPAHSLVFGPPPSVAAQRASTDEPVLRRYWMTSPPSPIRYRDARDYAQHFRHLWEQAVRDRLRGDDGEDVPSAGLLLSGGLDSSSVAAVAAARLPAPQLHCYRFTFGTLASCDESVPGDALAESLGLQVETLDAENIDLLGDAQTPLVAHAESPFLGWEGATNRVLRGLQERGTRVLLTGHGGDNLLTGSALVYADRLWSHPRSVWRQMRRHAHNHGIALHEIVRRCVLAPWLRELPGYGWLRRHQRSAAPWPPWVSPQLAARTRLAARMKVQPEIPRLGGWARPEIYTHALHLGMTGQAVAWHGRGGCAHAIDVRHPFLDRRLADFLLAIPPQQLFEGGCTKSLLRRALPELPDAVRERRTKTRFGAFLHQQLRERGRSRVEALLAESRAAAAGFIDLPALRQAYAETAGAGVPAAAFWFPITLEIWLRRQPIL